MGVYSWDLDGGFSSPPRVRTPRLTVRREYPDMVREHEEFEVETDKAGELPTPFWSETVRQVVVE